MRKYIVTVNGKKYEVEVEEAGSFGASARGAEAYEAGMHIIESKGRSKAEEQLKLKEKVSLLKLLCLELYLMLKCQWDRGLKEEMCFLYLKL